MRSTRGLVAPQNTFLDSIIRNCGKNDYFLLANARIVDYPIVYCSEGFTKLTGFHPTEVLQRSARCKFMCGTLTTEDSKIILEEAIMSVTRQRFSMIMYRKNNFGGPLCLMVQTSPIRNSIDEVVLILLFFHDFGSIPSALNGNKSLDRFDSEVIVGKRQTFMGSLKSFMNFRKNNKVAPISGFLDELTPRYHQEHPKTLPQIILHYSFFRNIWEWLILVLTLSSAIIVPFTVAFPVGAPADDVTMMVIDTVVDVVFFIDIILNFHTSFVDNSGQVRSRPDHIRNRYLRTWFVVDLISSLPYDVLYSIPALNGAMESYHELKLLRLFRLARIARTLDRYAEYGQALLVLLILAFLLVSHWFACIWFLVGFYETCTLIDEDSWLYRLSQDIGQNYSISFVYDFERISMDLWQWKFLRGNTSMDEISEFMIADGPTNLMTYLTALYFVLTSLTSVGFGNVVATTVMEKCVCSFIMIFGAILYASIFGNVTTVFQQLYMSTGIYHEMLNSIKEFMKNNDIPVPLKERALDYVISTWTVNKGVDMSKVLSYCPKDMRADICIHLNRKVLEENPAFRLASEGCLRTLAVHLTMMHSAPGDVIYHQGESLSGVCFVGSGSLEVVQDDEIVAILGPGDVFGDPLCKEVMSQCSASVRCLTYCDVHVINRDHLADILNFHQAFSQSFSRNLVFTCNLRSRFIFRKIDDLKRENELMERDQKEEDNRTEPLRKLLASRIRRQSTTNKKSDLNNRTENQISIQNNFSFQKNLKMPTGDDPNELKDGGRSELSIDATMDKNKIHQENLNSQERTKIKWIKEEIVSTTTEIQKEKITNLEKECMLLDASMMKAKKFEIKNLLKRQLENEKVEMESRFKPPLTLTDQQNLIRILTKMKLDMTIERENVTKRMLEVESNIGQVLSALLVNMNSNEELMNMQYDGEASNINEQEKTGSMPEIAKEKSNEEPERNENKGVEVGDMKTTINEDNNRSLIDMTQDLDLL